MAKISKILEKNEKMLDITRFLTDEMRSLDKEYITIRKLNTEIQEKLKFSAMLSSNSKVNKIMSDYCKEKGLKIQDMEKIKDNSELLSLIADIKYSPEEIKQLEEYTIQNLKTMFDCGICKNKHTFVDDDNKPVEIDYEFLISIGNKDLIEFVKNEIDSFSKGYELGESIGQALK